HTTNGKDDCNVVDRHHPECNRAASSDNHAAWKPNDDCMCNRELNNKLGTGKDRRRCGEEEEEEEKEEKEEE
ncbi:hypothetical protein LOAG_11095, partial [Loa loa]